ncbi:hypothetical protein [Streptomyces canus]|nr:hypothetical protein [Streptomyces canus]
MLSEDLTGHRLRRPLQILGDDLVVVDTVDRRHMLGAHTRTR